LIDRHRPVCFVSKAVFDEELLIVSRADHPFARVPTLDSYCDALHVLVSITGDPHSHVDDALASQGRSRRVALTVPNFLLTLALISQTDLISVMPESLVATHGARFGVIGTKAPLSLRRFRLHAVAPKVAMMDGGLEWLFDLLPGVAAR
jgi:DNA-binding transcriptional LysR family regulator